MSSPQPQGQSNSYAADAEANVDPGLMEKVLRETLLAEDGDKPIDPAELDVLLQVARRHAGESLSLEPVTVDLVQSFLAHRFGNQLRGAGDWDKMPREIAETLWEDPHSHDRLEVMWSQLVENVG